MAKYRMSKVIDLPRDPTLGPQYEWDQELPAAGTGARFLAYLERLKDIQERIEDPSPEGADEFELIITLRGKTVSVAGGTSGTFDDTTRAEGEDLFETLDAWTDVEP